MVIDRRVQDKVDAKRQEIVKTIIAGIDGIIMAESVISGESIDELIKRAALDLSWNALGLTIVFRFSDRDCFDGLIQGAMSRGIDWDKPESEIVGCWIMMQVALHFAEKAAVPFSDRLREYDRTN